MEQNASIAEISSQDLGQDDLLLQNGLSRLNFARYATQALLSDIPAEKWCFQPFAGANHALWVVGHLAVIDDFFLGYLAGSPARCPESFEKLFGRGTKPSPNLADYPAPELVQQHFGQRRAELLSWFGSRSAELLVAAFPADFRYAKNVAELMSSIAWHEGWHGGQLTAVRKGLGLGPKFG